MKKLRADIERYHRMRGRLGALSTTGFILGCMSPRMAPVTLLRLSSLFDENGLGILAKLCAVLNVFIFGVEASPKVEIGGGLFLPHTVGTVIGAARIGDNCTIMQGVTLGTSEPDMGFTVALRPVVGSDVLIGSGAKVIGPVVIGNQVKIGANAVVLKDIPANSVAVGIPAVVVASSHVQGVE
ncbi:MAG: serine acetyltransferase [Pseudomonadota bacterium]